MQTSLDLLKANCPYCFNETLDDLARLDGVNSVHGSIGGSCVVIDHDDAVTVDQLIERIHGHLHGVEMFSNEIQMVPIDPAVLARPCVHHSVQETSARSAVGTFRINPSMTLGEIVTLKPSLAAELQRQDRRRTR